MSIWGKILGASIGFAFGGPLGALVGAATGHYIGRFRADAVAAERIDEGSRSGTQRNDYRQISFAVSVVVLAAKLAKADGTVTRTEIEAFKKVFHIPEHEIKDVGKIFDEAKESSEGFEPYAYQVAQMFKNNPPVLEELLNALFYVAKSDNVIHAAELKYLQAVAKILGLKQSNFDRIHSIHSQKPLSDPYSILGVSRDMPDKELKARHRNLVLKHHPDKLIAEGMPVEFVEQANDKLACINAAYDEICMERRLN